MDADVQATFTATLVDEWARGGVRDAVVCPGSRSTPLALALADHPGVRVHVHHDERSGGFLALGRALADGRPVVVLTTSGTATVELHPAVVEAHHSGIPLLVCTADRPPELQDVGAAQTIDQQRLYGPATRWFHDPGVPVASSSPRWRPLAARALAETSGPPPGPVHLNLPFREPLVGVPSELPPAREPLEAALERGAGFAPLSTAGSSRWLERQGLIVAGVGSGPSVLPLAEALGWPVVADPRAEAWQPHPNVIPHLDAILRSEAARTVLRPEMVLRFGDPLASRVVNEWLATADDTVVIAPTWSDPEAVASSVFRTDPAAAAEVLLSTNLPPKEGASSLFRGKLRSPWGEVAEVAAEIVAASLDPATEPGIARDLLAALPDGGDLVVSSSMPVRDVERYAQPRDGVRVLANRGANGIDGVVSTAVGVALAGRPTALLIGDIAFLHDSNGLLGAAGRGVDLVVVVVDNDGGGIFSFLPQAGKLPGDRFEALFGTPHGLDLVALAAAYGPEASAVDGDVGAAAAEALAKGGVHVLVARTDRAANVEAHRRLDDAVAAAVTAAL